MTQGSDSKTKSNDRTKRSRVVDKTDLLDVEKNNMALRRVPNAPGRAMMTRHRFRVGKHKVQTIPAVKSSRY